MQQESERGYSSVGVLREIVYSRYCGIKGTAESIHVSHLVLAN